MKLHIVAVGTKMPAWVQTAYSEYEKRLSREWKPQLHELDMARRSKNTSTDHLKKREAEHILSLIPSSATVIALDVQGKSWSTEKLAEEMHAWPLNAHDVYWLIGGPDGLAPECLARANQSVSLSAMTLPHPLVRIVLIEQLYRGWSILNHHPYHK